MYHGSQEERRLLSRQLNKQQMVQCDGYEVKSFPVVVTSYEVAMRDKDALQRKQWEMVVIDEGHRIKNHQCRLGRCVELSKSPTVFNFLNSLQGNAAVQEQVPIAADWNSFAERPQRTVVAPKLSDS